ncbi:glycoside hydrolase family 55 protein [Luteimonas sp. XNQY3]|nr:glycoside hydrolase family 55 protein [Luteimonas sp. XNQY3]MCD9004923.1 glycoside hydrolase family 55 protein [Luteimonas sp. XNQY3]
MFKKILLALLFLAFNELAFAQNQWINVKDFGALGNGVSNDTAAVNSAIASIPARGGVIYFPSGRYLLQSRINLPDKRISITGDGIGISNLEWTTSSGGILYQPTIDAAGSGADNSREFSVSNITMRTAVAGGGVAIRAVWPETSGRVTSTFNIKDVEIRGSDFTKNWSGGIELEGAKFSKIMNVSLYGRNSSYSAMSYGIRINSNGSSTEYYIDNTTVVFSNIGLEVRGGTGSGNGPEGVYVNQGAFINVGSGVIFNTTSSEPLLFVRGVHINAYSAGIHSNALQAIYSNNLIYYGDDAFGIRIFGLSQDVLVRDNIFYGVRERNTTGVVVPAGPVRVSITGNHFDGCTTGIWMQSGSSGNFAAQNVFSNCTNRLLNQGTQNIVYGWGAAAP